MEEEVVYDIGNPCRYLHHLLKSLFRCLGLENDQDEEEGKAGNGSGGGNGNGDGGEVEDPPLPPSSDPPAMDPTDEPVSTSGTARRRPPPRNPISTGGPGQTN